MRGMCVDLKLKRGMIKISLIIRTKPHNKTWDEVSNEAEKELLPPISLYFYYRHKRLPTQKDLKKMIKLCILPDVAGKSKDKEFEKVKKGFYRSEERRVGK